MKCFVIMPFDKSFDDVYATLRLAVDDAHLDPPLICQRLDEITKAGRISDDLVKEIQSARLCIADLTGANANVMWEAGYAMAFQKPTLFISQNLADLPFDIRDMRTIEYHRSQLDGTLRPKLSEAIRSTALSYPAAFPLPAAGVPFAGRYCVNSNANEIVTVTHTSGNEYRTARQDGWDGTGVFDGVCYFGVFRYKDDHRNPEWRGVMGTHRAVRQPDGSFLVLGTNVLGRAGQFENRWRLVS